LAKRQYVANTHGYLHADSAFTEGISARKTGRGMEVNGTGHFVSFAGVADLLFLTLVDCPDPVALLFPLKGDQRITFGDDCYFPEVLRASDTRSISCEGVVVSPECMLDVARHHLLPGGAMSVVLLGWHLTLSSSAFLGGASYVIDQTLKFAKNFKTFDGRLLARLDDVVAAFGKIGIRYGAADTLINEYARSVAALSDARDRAHMLSAGLLAAQIANCHATELTEEISRRCRGLLGTRIFGPRYATLGRVTTELLMGPLAPRNNSILEKDVGHGMLAKSSFDGIRWMRSRTTAAAHVAGGE
jgi:alkylation response protein AidB-like acyl-CoA dehydrogenase